MQWAVCICGEVCENACRGKAYGRFGEASKSNNPGKEKNRLVIAAMCPLFNEHCVILFKRKKSTYSVLVEVNTKNH
jgi:hypothetical protein